MSRTGDGSQSTAFGYRRLVDRQNRVSLFRSLSSILLLLESSLFCSLFGIHNLFGFTIRLALVQTRSPGFVAHSFNVRLDSQLDWNTFCSPLKCTEAEKNSTAFGRIKEHTHTESCSWALLQTAFALFRATRNATAKKTLYFCFQTKHFENVRNVL